MKRILTILSILLLSITVNADYLLGGSTVDDRIQFIGLSDDSVVSDVLPYINPDEIFRELESNTYDCVNNCSAIYVFKNPLNQVFSIAKKRIQFWDKNRKNLLPDGIVELTSVEYFNINTREKLNGLTEIPANTRIAVRIKGNKPSDIITDWVPWVCIDASDFPLIDGRTDQICISQDWALWGNDGDLTTAYYKCDETNYPADNLEDSTSNAYDGSVTGATSTTGYIGGGIEFDYDNGDYVLLADESEGEDQFKSFCDNGCTFGGWIDYNGITGKSYYTISKYSGGSGEMFFYLSSSGGNDFRASIANGATTGRAYVQYTPPSSDDWHNVYVVYNGSDSYAGNALIYYDGELVSVSDDAIQLNNTWDTTDVDVLIGRQAIGDTDGMNGTLDEIIFFDYALTPEQIEGIYNNQTIETPIVYSPIEDFYNQGNDITIGYTNSSSITGSIVLYNTSLYDYSTLTWIKNINLSINNNTFDYTIVDNEGMYTIGVQAKDSQGLLSNVGYSANFSIQTTTTTTTTTTTIVQPIILNIDGCAEEKTVCLDQYLTFQINNGSSTFIPEYCGYDVINTVTGGIIYGGLADIVNNSVNLKMPASDLYEGVFYVDAYCNVTTGGGSIFLDTPCYKVNVTDDCYDNGILDTVFESVENIDRILASMSPAWAVFRGIYGEDTTKAIIQQAKDGNGIWDTLNDFKEVAETSANTVKDIITDPPKAVNGILQYVLFLIFLFIQANITLFILLEMWIIGDSVINGRGFEGLISRFVNNHIKVFEFFIRLAGLVISVISALIDIGVGILSALANAIPL